MGFDLSIIVKIVILIIYFKLFMKARVQPFFAFIPILNTYTLCRIVDAVWAFWMYVIAFAFMIGALIEGSPMLLLLVGLATLIVNIIVYVRLLIACRDEMLLAIALIVLEVVAFFM